MTRTPSLLKKNKKKIELFKYTLFSSIMNITSLAIGINYTNNPHGISQLDGCVPDALYVDAYLRETFPTIEQHLLLDSQATKAAIMQKLQQIVQGVNNRDSVGVSTLLFFYYSGHGTIVTDSSSQPDEKDGHDEVIVPFDGQLIVDDFFHSQFLSLLPASCTCVMIVDACNSGTFADCKYNYKLSNTLNWVADETSSAKTCPATVYCLSASSDNEYARESYFSRYEMYRGYFTVALQEMWVDPTVFTTKTIYETMSWIQSRYLGVSSFSPQFMNITSTENLLPTFTIGTLFSDIQSQIQVRSPSTWPALPFIEYSSPPSLENSNDYDSPTPTVSTLVIPISPSSSSGLIMLILVVLAFLMMRTNN